VVVGEAVCLVFGLVPTGAEAEDQPAPGDLVDGDCLLGQHRRAVKRSRCDQGAELDTLRDFAEGSKNRPHLPRAPHPLFIAVEEMVANPERVETYVFGGPGDITDFGPAILPFHFR
jgi:hypothetical protein